MLGWGSAEGREQSEAGFLLTSRFFSSVDVALSLPLLPPSIPPPSTVKASQPKLGAGKNAQAVAFSTLFVSRPHNLTAGPLTHLRRGRIFIFW